MTETGTSLRCWGIECQQAKNIRDQEPEASESMRVKVCMGFLFGKRREELIKKWSGEFRVELEEKM